MEHLASATEPLTLTALSQHFNLSKATMHRILVTLRERGYVVRDPITARYGFGLTATRLVQQAGVAESLTEACWPAMRWLWNRTEETVLLAVRDGDQSVIVEKLDSNRPVLATYSLGRLMPLHAVSTGLALLAHHPDSEIREILTAAPYPATPLTRPPPLTPCGAMSDLPGPRVTPSIGNSFATASLESRRPYEAATHDALQQPSRYACRRAGSNRTSMAAAGRRGSRPRTGAATPETPSRNSSRLME